MCLTFLGIEVDTRTLQFRLPSDKHLRLKEELAAAVSKRCLSKRTLQSLTGLLQHTTKVVRPGRPFLHCLYALQNVGSLPTHHIRLNQAARADITWWSLFVERWNGLSIAWDLKQCLPDSVVYSDASGSWGLLSQSLVSTGVASPIEGASHSHKRTVFSGNLSSTVWEAVVWSSGGIQSGQYGSSSSNPSNILQRLPPHAPH